MKVYNNHFNPSIQLKNLQSTQKRPDFKTFLLEKIKEVDESQKKAYQVLEALAKGEDIDLSDVAFTPVSYTHLTLPTNREV